MMVILVLLSTGDLYLMVAATLTKTSGSSISTRSVRLTPTQIKVLSFIAQGHSSKEAADRLVVSKRTVDYHLANIYEKLQVNNRVAALRVAIRLGLIPFEPFFGHSQEEA